MLFTLIIFLMSAWAGETSLPRLTMADLLAQTKSSDWRELKPENTLYLELANGRVVIELAPQFAPKHTDNIKLLAKEKYWDGLAIVRVQDNYVVQWGDPNAEKPELKRKIVKAKESLNPEFDQPLSQKISFTPLADTDVYAPQVGFSDGFPMARDEENKKMWLTHCYGAVGAGRGMTAESGSGAELYVVIGHSPRHLDRNVTLVGRVLQGMELLSSLPRGKGNLGFYEDSKEHVVIKQIRLASQVTKKERTSLEVLKTDTELFKKLILARKNREEDWFINKANHIELCNVPIPVRLKP